MRLTARQKAIVVGSILGDGYLQKTGKQNARLRLEHGFLQKEYLLWKISLLGGKVFSQKPTFLKRIHPQTQRTYQYWRWQSNASPILGKYRTIFYPHDRKVIPLSLAQLFRDPLTLLVWYLDDGFYYPRDHCAYLYLGKISFKEAEIAQKAFLENFGLAVKILDKKRKGLAFYFPPAEVLKLKDLLEKLVIPSMSYKLPA